MIMACCVLHNIANRYGEPLPQELEIAPLDIPVDPPNGAEDNRAALALRQQLIGRFWSKDAYRHMKQITKKYIFI